MQVRSRIHISFHETSGRGDFNGFGGFAGFSGGVAFADSLDNATEDDADDFMENGNEEGVDVTGDWTRSLCMQPILKSLLSELLETADTGLWRSVI